MRNDGDWNIEWQQNIWKTEREIWLENSDYKIKHFIPLVKESWIKELMKFHREVPLTNFAAREVFEKELAKFVSSKYTVATNSGTSAILMCLMALNIRSGDVVIGPNYGHPAWINACKILDINPLPVDIREKTLCINPDLIKPFINHRTKAILFLNHAGYVGEDLLKVKDICDEHKIYMIEDSCNALGQRYKGIHAGCFGDLGTVSFSGPKLITCGEGGAVIVNSDEIYQNLKEIQYQGGWYSTVEKSIRRNGGNFNMPPQNAFYLLQQLMDIDYILERRNTLKENYIKNNLCIHEYETDEDTGYSFYLLKTKKAEKIFKKLEFFKIQSLYKQYRSIHKRSGFYGDFPVTEKMVKNVLSLPFSPELSFNEIKSISTIVRRLS